jgi:hypothetical protein
VKKASISIFVTTTPDINRVQGWDESRQGVVIPSAYQPDFLVRTLQLLDAWGPNGMPSDGNLVVKKCNLVWKNRDVTSM